MPPVYLFMFFFRSHSSSLRWQVAVAMSDAIKAALKRRTRLLAEDRGRIMSLPLDEAADLSQRSLDAETELRKQMEEGLRYGESRAGSPLAKHLKSAISRLPSESELHELMRLALALPIPPSASAAKDGCDDEEDDDGAAVAEFSWSADAGSEDADENWSSAGDTDDESDARSKEGDDEGDARIAPNG
jgi:hypothetical protein